MRQPNILVVDDSKIIRKHLSCMLLDDLQAKVTVAHDGVEGFELAKANYFDLIISDVDMPRMNGFTLCKTLKSDQTTRAVPVIILSSKDKDRYVEQGFEIGAAAYVSKNDANFALIPCVKDVLSKSSLLRGKLVLVVDNSKFIRNIVGDGLAQQGFKVAKAENGKEALEKLDTIKPDIILSDIMLPVMDGMEFLTEVRKRNELHDTPFIVMSTENNRRVMRQMMQGGASAFLVKPFNVDQLVITAEKLLSDHVTILLNEKKRLESERSMLVGSISSLAQALEARDAYTRGHSEMVATIVSRMAEQMNFTPEDQQNIALAAKLHDVGKIGIRDEVLLKPGKLTDSEYTVIKEHPVKGAEILDPIKHMDNMLPAVLHHHERFDGSGYPDGLKGDDIPLWARMISVADVYDALTSNRPYRDPMARQHAFDIIRDEAGTHFCPKCVEVFFKVMQDEH